MERSLERIDAFTSPSRFSAEKHREFGFSREMEVIPYFLPELESGIETGDRHPADIDDGVPYFLFVGRLERIKGAQDLLRHFPADGKVQLLIAGDGGYESELRRLAGDSRVRFLGLRTQEQLRWLYRDALAVLVPSLCFETFGIVILEAFREATPVVCRRRGPFTEIVEKSGGGLLFESHADLAENLSRLGGSPELRTRLGTSGHGALRKYWSEDVVLEQYLGLIERLVSARRERSATAGPAA